MDGVLKLKDKQNLYMNLSFSYASRRLMNVEQASRVLASLYLLWTNILMKIKKTNKRTGLRQAGWLMSFKGLFTYWPIFFSFCFFSHHSIEPFFT